MKKFKKIWCFILILVTIMVATNASNGAYIKLNEKDENTKKLIKDIYEFKQSLSIEVMNNHNEAVTKIAEKIVELCNYNDIEKAEVFLNTYEQNGIEIWCGDYNSQYADDLDYISAKKAKDIVEKNNKNNTSENVENITQDEMLKMENEIYDLEEKIREMIKNNDSDDNILMKVKELDKKIKNYNSKYGGHVNDLSRVMSSVDMWYKEYATEGDDYQTAQDEANKEIEEQKKNQSSSGVLGESSADANHTIDEVLNEAKDFLNAGKGEQSKIDGTVLKTASNTLYNMLLSIGIIIAVAVGMYLGVKFMLSSAEDKAKVKESLIPYIAGCVVIFGAFVIWKLAILLLGGIT